MIAPHAPALPPLALYVHLPWCARKCPYCDFNSYALREGEIPEDAYVDALLADLELEWPLAQGRPLESIFIGGGTPSLFSAAAISRLLDGIGRALPLSGSVEITLEANPGTVERERFYGYREAGINRLSIGVQSFQDRLLRRLGRIHDGQDAQRAVAAATDAGFENLNLDLMFGLPDQRLDECLDDLRAAMALGPTHLSLYQLTLEPNTAFAARPPRLPDEDALWAMQEAAHALLRDAGFRQYEVSAFAREGRECRHNRNYWEFGDYLAIGADAHGKYTVAKHKAILRRVRHRQPQRYLRAAGERDFIAEEHAVAQAELPFEFFLNALRLTDGVPAALFGERTGLAIDTLEPLLQQARRDGLLDDDRDRLRPSALGRRFLNNLLDRFLPDA